MDAGVDRRPSALRRVGVFGFARIAFARELTAHETRDVGTGAPKETPAQVKD